MMLLIFCTKYRSSLVEFLLAYTECFFSFVFVPKAFVRLPCMTAFKNLYQVRVQIILVGSTLNEVSSCFVNLATFLFCY